MTHKLKYLLTALVLLLLAAQVLAIARAPTPYCTSKPLVKQFPLTSEQILTYDMSKTFTGYNLNITMGTNNSWASMTAKHYVLDRKLANFTNIISHYVQPKDNSVGRDSFILYSEQNGTIKLSYGVIRDKGQLPDISSTVTVTSDKNVVCFDAALFMDHGLAIVDCAVTGTSVFSSYKNVFYVIDLTDHSLKKVVQNDMYIGFREVTRRKLMKFSHPQAGGFTYLLRSYFSDGVDKANSENTYMQIFIVPVQDPTIIEPIRIIDRTSLQLNTLRIMDVEIYLDDIFVLDYDSGLYRLDILQSQRVVKTGHYKQFGFQKFAVYSDDLEDELIIALSNKHSVYEIEWHHTATPNLVNKYSLMQNSKVKQVFLNDRYVIVQSSADAFNSSNPKFQIDYTWIFSKGARTYTNAYHIINHNNSVVQIEFDRQKSHLYVADSKGMTLREISDAMLIMHLMNDSLVGKQEDIVIFAESYDPNSNQTFRCQEKLTAIFVAKDSMTIFPTGLDPTSVYSVNYPNPLEIPLDPYYMGPDMHYSLLNHKGDQLPLSWINKVNRTKVLINPQPKPEDMVFFHTDIIPQLGHQVLIYYYQDSSNNTHVAECIHQWVKAQMNCTVVATYNHTSRIRSFTSTGFLYDKEFNYYYNIVFEGDGKFVHIYDFGRQKIIAQIQYKGDFDADVSSLGSSNGFLYVLRKNIKTIDVYNLGKCSQTNTCVPDFSINAFVMKSLGVNYFSPQKITTDNMHPQVLFIHCLGSLIILDVDNKEKLHLLDQVINPATAVRNFQVAVSETRLVIVGYPNFIFEYTLQHLYIYNMVTLTKTLSTYGMSIQPNADVQFSDFNGLVYVNAYDPKKNVSVIIIYRTGHAASISLYAMVELDKLYSRPGFQVQVSGYFVDFMTIIAGSTFHVYRVFSIPFLTIDETAQDFSFKLQVYNQQSNQTSNQVNVTVVNRKQIITPTSVFNQTQNNLKASAHGNYEWDDRQWFDGSIIRYNYTCDECHLGDDSKVILREHIDRFKDLDIGGNHYIQTMMGGIGVYQDLFRFRPNGSISSISNLPDQKTLQKCIRVAATQNEIFAVTACQILGQGMNLYVTSFASYKSFTWGPFFSLANYARNLQLVNDILMLANTQENPEYLFNKGSIYLYRVSFNTESGDQMDELEVIDSNDFVGAAGWTEDDAYLGNAHLVYSGNINAYRLYVTEVRYGFFIVDFVRSSAFDAEITILSTTFINVKKLLQDADLHMPIDAAFLAIHYVKTTYHPSYDNQNIIITTKGYDNFQIALYFDDQGHVKAPVLHRVYQRYAYYNAVNEVQARNGFIVMGYIVPPNSPVSLHRHQYITLYDSLDYPHESDKGYSQRYMIGSVPLNTTIPAGFAINTTYDFHSNGTRSGIVLIVPINQFQKKLVGASIAHNLTLSLAEGYKDQTIDIMAFNDFSNFTFSAVITKESEKQTDNNTIVIIIIVLCCIVFVFFLFYIFSIVKKRKPVEERESLLTENQTIARQSVQQSASYQPPTIDQEQIVIVRPVAEQMVREESDDSDSDDQEETVPVQNQTISTEVVEKAPVQVQKQETIVVASEGLPEIVAATEVQKSLEQQVSKAEPVGDGNA